MTHNGHIIPGTGIAVDHWKVVGDKNKYVHFLTHMHGDHIVGLTSTWMRRIYCSAITAQLLVERCGVSKSLLSILPLNEVTIVNHGSVNFSVTAFDADHCPGAIMLYFEGDFGRIFYTGDFRSSLALINRCKTVAMCADVLYLDNTYCNERYDFPSRETCFQQILTIIRQHPEKKIILGIRNLGKEVLLAELGVALNEMIVVSPVRYKLCQTIFDTNVFVTPYDSRGVRIWADSRNGALGFNRGDDQDTILIRPTAILSASTSPQYPVKPNVYVVPYSDHSSFPELKEFVSALAPKTIRPIVTGNSGNHRNFKIDDMACFDAFLCQREMCPTMDSHKSELLINHSVYGDDEEAGILDIELGCPKYYIDTDRCNGRQGNANRSEGSLRLHQLASFGSEISTKRKKCKKRPPLKRSKSSIRGIVYIDEDQAEESNNINPVSSDSSSHLDSSQLVTDKSDCKSSFAKHLDKSTCFAAEYSQDGESSLPRRDQQKSCNMLQDNYIDLTTDSDAEEP